MRLAAGFHAWHRWRLHRRDRQQRPRHRALLEDDVRVRARDAKAAHARAPRGPRLTRPGARLLQQLEPTALPSHVLARLVDVKCLGKALLLERQHHLDHAKNARRRLRVTDVRLGGAQPQRSILRTRWSEHLRQSARLDWIAEARARTVRLNRVDVVRGQPARSKRALNDALLARAVRCGQALAAAVLVDRAPTHHGENAIARATGVGQALERQHTASLGPTGSIGGGRKCLTPTIERHHPLARAGHEGRWGAHGLDAARKRQIALALTKRGARQVHRHERGRARGVDGHRRPLQPQHVRQASRDDARLGPGSRVPGHRVERVVIGAVVGADRAEVHARQAVGKLGGDDTG